MSKPVRMAMILCAVALSFALASVSIGQPKPPPLRIGTFDSRAIALAFYSSEEGKKQLEHGGGPGLKMRPHQQTYSTGQVTDIIEKMKTALPPIAKEAGVSLIISKWEIAYKDSSVEYVDVTPDLVKLFSPSDEMLKIIEDLRKRKPVPIETMWTVPKD